MMHFTQPGGIGMHVELVVFTKSSSSTLIQAKWMTAKTPPASSRIALQP